MNQDKIGKFIYKLRTEKKLSQYQLADMIPISRQAVSKWERGESIPDSSTLMRLSEIFDVSINELLIGQRSKANSIKELESTTLNIIDESNKKSKKIKRNFITSVIIITILLLSFLSYYFINSYNSTKVYTISGNNKTFVIKDGILITMKSRTYFKINKIYYDEKTSINNIKLYYLVESKEKIVTEDKDLENFTIMDLDGYSETFSKKELKYILNDTYIEINYDDNKTEKIKLNFKRDFSNDDLVFKETTNYKAKSIKVTKKKKFSGVSVGTVVGVMGVKKENNEITFVEDIPKMVEKLQQLENPPEIVLHDITLEENKNEILTFEKKLDLEKTITLLKEKGYEFGGSYIYEIEEDGMIFLYYEVLNQLTLYKNDDFMWDYYYDDDRYNCSTNYIYDCKEDINETLLKYLN